MRSRDCKQLMYQLGSLIAVAVIAVWAIAILWLFFSRANVIDASSAIPLISLAIALVLVLPFNAFRFRWSYAASIVAFLGLLALAAVQALEITEFAFSARTVATISVAIIAVKGLVASVLAFRRSSAREWWKPAVAVVAVLAVVAVSYVILSSNADGLEKLRAAWIQDRIERRLAGLDSLDEKIHFLQKEGGLPTLAVGVVVGDELAWNRTFGEQAGANPIFNIGSATKPFVATAVMQLIERGLLDPSADVNEYLSFSLRHPDAPGTPITVRMLLTHRSGLSHYTARYASYTAGPQILEWAQEELGQSIYGEITNYDPRPELGDFLASYLAKAGELYSDDVWTTRPGTTYSYSTTGYDLLGFIVSQVTGMPFEDYLRQNVLVPLGMTSTGLSLDQAPERRAIPYDLDSGILFEARVPMPVYDRQIVGGGGITSTVRDLSRFMVAHLNDGQVDGSQILTRESTEAMHLLRVTSTADIGMTGYGYGFNTMRDGPWQYYGHSYNFHGSIGHGGKDYGYMSRLFFVPAEGCGYGSIILTNRSDFLDSDLTWFFGIILKIENLLLEEAARQQGQLAQPPA